MTQDEFDKYMFGAGMTAKYKNETYAIATINIEEKLFGLVDLALLDGCEDDDVFWVRCESVEMNK